MQLWVMTVVTEIYKKTLLTLIPTNKQSLFKVGCIHNHNCYIKTNKQTRPNSVTFPERWNIYIDAYINTV